jgi:hypothetical protein
LNFVCAQVIYTIIHTSGTGGASLGAMGGLSVVNLLALVLLLLATAGSGLSEPKTTLQTTTDGGQGFLIIVDDELVAGKCSLLRAQPPIFSLHSISETYQMRSNADRARVLASLICVDVLVCQSALHNCIVAYFARGGAVHCSF